MTEANANCEVLSPPASAAKPLLIKAFEPGAQELWNRFVMEQPRASFFHLIGWKRIIEKTFGHKARYFYSERDGEITGIAPIFECSNWLIGRCFISIPLAAYGGIVAADSESELALLEHSKQIAQSASAEYLELRQRGGGILEAFHENHLYTTFSAPLFPDAQANLKRLPKDTRYMIRKAEKGGLRMQLGVENLDVFYDLFAKSVHRLGTPVFPQSLFRNIVQEFPEHTQLMLVYNSAEAVTGVLSFFFRDTILPYYAGATPEATRLAANNFMYWQLIKWAGEHGFRTFDFGRSKKSTGAYAFKTQWNMNAEVLDYQVFLVKRKTVPNFSPVNPKFEMAIRLWQSLPLSLTKLLGPSAVRLFP
ncbi:MAG TPA: FemAB family XrtA/PEP-CTERM system-associated protein [Candidatus Acidoferrum sp.]|jgi:FemAB-related protein (PEP-CTERM system-associated)